MAGKKEKLTSSGWFKVWVGIAGMALIIFAGYHGGKLEATVASKRNAYTIENNVKRIDRVELDQRDIKTMLHSISIDAAEIKIEVKHLAKK